LHNFKETIKLLRESGISVLTSGTNDDVFKELEHHGVVALIGESNMHRTYQRAVAQARELLGKKE
jgi:hypothetical protein